MTERALQDLMKQYYEEALAGTLPGGGGGGQVDSVVGGTDISVDNTDPANPIVNYTGSGGGLVVQSFNSNISLTAADAGKLFFTDSISAPVTVNLPFSPPTGYTVGVRCDAPTGVFVAAGGGETIEGFPLLPLYRKNTAYFTYDGSNYVISNRDRAFNVTLPWGTDQQIFTNLVLTPPAGSGNWGNNPMGQQAGTLQVLAVAGLIDQFTTNNNVSEIQIALEYLPSDGSEVSSFSPGNGTQFATIDIFLPNTLGGSRHYFDFVEPNLGGAVIPANSSVFAYVSGFNATAARGITFNLLGIVE